MNPILPGAPWLIAHRSMLGINKPYKITLNGQDYVLWQTSDREVFALNNICPHQQAPLSEGWICQERNTITCPFHVLEFDGQGRLYREGKEDGQAITQPLDVIVEGDRIWTYGGYEPKLPIPDLISKLSEGMEFLGVAGETSSQGDFLSNMSINYDYNHQNGTHRELFKIKANRIPLFEHNGYYAKVVQELERDDYTFGELLSNPALLTFPKTSTGTLEYSFPSTTTFRSKFSMGSILQLHILYPETEEKTKAFVLVYGTFNSPLLRLLLRKSFVKAVAAVVEQDVKTVESLYPREKAKIRLPNEEIIAYAEKLYHDW